MELTDTEKSEIDFRIMGNMIYDQTFALSRKVNTDLLEPISQWIDDPSWMVRFKVYETESPNWAEYKRRQREWTEQQKKLFGDRMKAYWQEIHRRKNLRAEIASIIPRAGPKTAASLINSTTNSSDFLTPILSPFSPQEQHRAEIHQEFTQALSLTVSNLLPWKMLLAHHISRTRKLSELPVHYPEDTKKDTASKLMHLLDMDQAGEITIRQNEPFGDIVIEPSANAEPEGSFTIIDSHANEYEFNWHDLSDAQRNKVIADIKENRILCKVG